LLWTAATPNATALNRINPRFCLHSRLRTPQ
jgi:hypothetical protein